MIPSFKKKNGFEDKVQNKTTTVSKQAKTGLIALVAGISMVNASSSISNAEIVKSMMDADKTFVLKPTNAPFAVARHGSHQSHSSHESHESHQSHQSSSY